MGTVVGMTIAGVIVLAVAVGWLVRTVRQYPGWRTQVIEDMVGPLIVVTFGLILLGPLAGSADWPEAWVVVIIVAIALVGVCALMAWVSGKVDIMRQQDHDAAEGWPVRPSILPIKYSVVASIAGLFAVAIVSAILAWMFDYARAVEALLNGAGASTGRETLQPDAVIPPIVIPTLIAFMVAVIMVASHAFRRQRAFRLYHEAVAVRRKKSPAECEVSADE